MNTYTILKELGLTDNEIKAYLALLETGTGQASLIAKKTGLPRSTARFTLDLLMERGLCLRTKKGPSFIYIAENPKKLLYLIESEREKIDGREAGLNRILGDLQKIFNPAAILPKVVFYESFEGMERLMDDITKDPSDISSFGAGDYFIKSFPDLIAKIRSRAKLGNAKIKVIRPLKYKDLHKDDPKTLESRYFLELDELKVDFQISKNQVCISSIEKNAPMSILIENTEIAKAFRQIFDELWGRLNP